MSPAPPHSAETAVETAVETVAEIGAQGDGIIRRADGTIAYAPFALPGEAVVLGADGAVRIHAPAADRIAPACRHFGRCGNCRLQHWREAPYLDWKRTRIREALARVGVEGAISAPLAAWGAGRRRTALHARRDPARKGLAGIVLGYAERAAHRSVAIAECPVLHPELEALLPVLPELAGVFLRHRPAIALHLTRAENGVDVDIRGAAPKDGFKLSADERVGIGRFAEAHGILRISAANEPMALRTQPLARFGEALVPLPAGAFLQASAAGEAALAAFAVNALTGIRRAADLFAGCGAFALRLVEFAGTTAFELDGDMCAAMVKGFSTIPGRRRLDVVKRDLFRAPLSREDLKGVEGLVLDPPRAGAEAQSRLLPASKVARIAYVSCDVQSFARDARVLVDGGFRLAEVLPVDQFRWSHHVELAARFER